MPAITIPYDKLQPDDAERAAIEMAAYKRGWNDREDDFLAGVEHITGKLENKPAELVQVFDSYCPTCEGGPRLELRGVGPVMQCPQCKTKYMATRAGSKPATSVSDVRSALTDKELDWLVSRFLCWPLPASVRSDLCVSEPNYKHPRTGTNLLTAIEARQMFRAILTPDG